VHGGILATVLDEAMVWAATWSGKRFCVCGELNVRFKALATIGQPVEVRAKVVLSRARLIQTEGTILDAAANVLVTSTAKYVPLAPDKNRAFVATLVNDTAHHSDIPRPEASRRSAGLTNLVDLYISSLRACIANRGPSPCI